MGPSATGSTPSKANKPTYNDVFSEWSYAKHGMSDAKWWVSSKTATLQCQPRAFTKSNTLQLACWTFPAACVPNHYHEICNLAVPTSASLESQNSAVGMIPNSWEILIYKLLAIICTCHCAAKSVPATGPLGIDGPSLVSSRCVHGTTKRRCVKSFYTTQRTFIFVWWHLHWPCKGLFIVENVIRWNKLWTHEKTVALHLLRNSYSDQYSWHGGTSAIHKQPLPNQGNSWLSECECYLMNR